MHTAKREEKGKVSFFVVLSKRKHEATTLSSKSGEGLLVGNVGGWTVGSGSTESTSNLSSVSTSSSTLTSSSSTSSSSGVLSVRSGSSSWGGELTVNLNVDLLLLLGLGLGSGGLLLIVSKARHDNQLATDLSGEELVNALSDKGLAFERLASDLSTLLLAESESLLGLLSEELVVRLVVVLGLGWGLLGLLRGSVLSSWGSWNSLLSLGVLLTLNLGCTSAIDPQSIS